MKRRLLGWLRPVLDPKAENKLPCDGPGPSGEELIRLLATLPTPWRVEGLILSWDAYLEGSPEVQKREAEVDPIIGRSICRVNPGS
jgi:hypothetical protein